MPKLSKEHRQTFRIYLKVPKQQIIKDLFAEIEIKDSLCDFLVKKDLYKEYLLWRIEQEEKVKAKG